MFTRIVFSACLAGLAAGLVLTAVQALHVVPVILEAETYEGHASDHGHDAHSHASEEEWAPGEGTRRLFFSAVSNVAAAIGFALLLCAAYAVRGGVSWRQGVLWGAAGYMVFFLNPAIGLPPEVPGTFAAELSDRQLWWALTVACTATGLYLLVLKRAWTWRVAGAALVVVPHIIGAPHPAETGGLAPASLATQFIVASAVANAVFWLLLGPLSALSFQKLARA